MMLFPQILSKCPFPPCPFDIFPLFQWEIALYSPTQNASGSLWLHSITCSQADVSKDFIVGSGFFPRKKID
jgi:hypothetical protein